MALIKCPECNKEISDKVKACPYCGYPFEQQEEAQKVEISSVNIKMKKENKKKIIILDNINKMKVQMIITGSEAEGLMNKTSMVWSNAIFKKSDSETDKYTMVNGEFVDDFNDALSNLFLDSETLDTISSIKDGQVKVANIIKDLKNPPKEYEKVYDTITDLSTAFISVTDFAINPKGNLQTFNKNVQEKIDKFMDLYNTLDAQIPN